MSLSEGLMQELHSEATDLSDCLYGLGVCKLVVRSQGNASVFLPEHDIVLIKATGVVCEEAHHGSIVGVHLESGEVFSIDGGDPLKPSTDLASHLHIYRELGNHAEHPVRAIIHTHSVNATAIAAFETPILPVVTGIADCFGEEIPCLSYAEIGGDLIGRGVVECIQQRFVKGVLLAKHGVVTIGSDLEQAFSAAVMVENCAETYLRSITLAKAWGQPLACLSPEQVASNHDRYANDYGQGRD